MGAGGLRMRVLLPPLRWTMRESANMRSRRSGDSGEGFEAAGIVGGCSGDMNVDALSDPEGERGPCACAAESGNCSVDDRGLSPTGIRGAGRGPIDLREESENERAIELRAPGPPVADDGVLMAVPKHADIEQKFTNGNQRLTVSRRDTT